MGEARARKEVSRPGISRRVPLSCLLPLAPACHLTFNFFHAAFQNSPAKHLLKKRGTFSTLRVCSQSSTVKGEVVPFRFHNEMWPDCQIFIHCGSVDPPPPIRRELCLKVCRWSCRVNRPGPEMSGRFWGSAALQVVC